MFDFLHTLTGPEFLFWYAIWFGLVFGAVLILRRSGRESTFVDCCGAAAYLGLGIARMAVGTAHGMHKWAFLVIMMAVGVLCFFIRVSKVSGGDSSGSTWFSSCSSGGGCGGGGGGCGGCGGS